MLEPTDRQKQWLELHGVQTLPADLDRREASAWIEEIIRYLDASQRGTVRPDVRVDLFERPPTRAPKPTQEKPSSRPEASPPPSTPQTVKETTMVSPPLPPAPKETVRGTQPLQATVKALSPEPDESPEFVSGSDVVVSLLVRPEVSLETAKQIWNAYRQFREFILQDPACADDIEGGREMNRTGATRLAVAFGLSIEERSTEVQEVREGNQIVDERFIARVRVSKGGRYVDALGTARLSESPPQRDIGWREHAATTKAFTRAVKRGIADILGGTEAEG